MNLRIFLFEIHSRFRQVKRAWTVCLRSLRFSGNAAAVCDLTHVKLCKLWISLIWGRHRARHFLSNAGFESCIAFGRKCRNDSWRWAMIVRSKSDSQTRLRPRSGTRRLRQGGAHHPQRGTRKPRRPTVLKPQYASAHAQPQRPCAQACGAQSVKYGADGIRNARARRGFCAQRQCVVHELSQCFGGDKAYAKPLCQ